MERQLKKLGECLNETVALSKTHREIAQIDLIEYNDFHQRINSEFEDAEKYFESFQKLVKEYNEDKTKFNNELVKIKLLLSDAIENLNNLFLENDKEETESKFGNKHMEPNNDFLKILQQNILTTSSKIFIEINSKKVFGSFTEDGYFKLDLNDKTFSSLTTASSYVYNKSKAKGWQLWLCIDKTGIVRKLEFYQKQIT